MKCPICGMMYVPEYLEDVRAHRIFHDEVVNGVYARKIKSDKICWEKGDFRITVVNYFSPIAQKRRAEEAGILAHRDTPFDFAPYHSKEDLDRRNVHIFLLSRKIRIIGFLILEKRDYIQKFTWKEYENAGGKKLSKGEAIWSIGLVWIHRKYRKMGLGSQFVQAVASYFNIEAQSIGWHTPFTGDGKKLAKSLCPKSFYVAK